MTTKQAIIIAVIVIAFILGTIFYVKYESVFNTLVALFTYGLGAVSGFYVGRMYAKRKSIK